MILSAYISWCNTNDTDAEMCLYLSQVNKRASEDAEMF